VVIVIITGCYKDWNRQTSLFLIFCSLFLINLAYSPDMKLLTDIISKLRNKYVVAFSVFVVIMLFLDKSDLFTQMSRTRQLRQLEQSREYYIAKIAEERTELEKLKSNPATLEKYAREKYLMKRDNEDLFLVPGIPQKENK
jgi:cell division protein DivIC